MKIVLDENNYVIGYCTLGNIDNSIEVESFPEDFEKYWEAYQYISDSFIIDNNKKAEIDNRRDEK